MVNVFVTGATHLGYSDYLNAVRAMIYELVYTHRTNEDHIDTIKKLRRIQEFRGAQESFK